MCHLFFNFDSCQTVRKQRDGSLLRPEGEGRYFWYYRSPRGDNRLIARRKIFQGIWHFFFSALETNFRKFYLNFFQIACRFHTSSQELFRILKLLSKSLYDCWAFCKKFNNFQIETYCIFKILYNLTWKYIFRFRRIF